MKLMANIILADMWRPWLNSIKFAVFQNKGKVGNRYKCWPLVDGKNTTLTYSYCHEDRDHHHDNDEGDND